MHITNFLISDFDFTLCTHHDMSQMPANLQAIKNWRKNGNLFAIATGRSVTGLHTDFPECKEYADFIVYNDGALVHDKHGCPIMTHVIPTKVAENLKAILDDHPFAEAVTYISYRGSRDLPGIQTTGSNKFRLWFKSKEDCQAIAKKLEQLKSKLRTIAYYDVTNFDTRLDWVNEDYRHVIEVTGHGTDKAVGIEAIANMANVPRNHIYTIGDDINDRDMIERYNGFIVSTGNPTLLKYFPSSRVVHSVASLIETLQKAPV